MSSSSSSSIWSRAARRARCTRLRSVSRRPVVSRDPGNSLVAPRASRPGAVLVAVELEGVVRADDNVVVCTCSVVVCTDFVAAQWFWD